MTQFRPHTPTMSGFTLVELMTAIAVLAILAAIAVPSFRPIIENWRVRDAAAELQSTLYFARSEAVKRGGNVSVVANSKSNDWSTGWEVQDNAGNILQQGAVPTDTTVAQAAPGAQTIYFDRWGMASDNSAAGGGAKALSFLIKPTGGSDTGYAAIRVCVSQGGSSVQERQGGACPT